METRPRTASSDVVHSCGIVGVRNSGITETPQTLTLGLDKDSDEIGYAFHNINDSKVTDVAAREAAAASAWDLSRLNFFSKYSMHGLVLNEANREDEAAASIAASDPQLQSSTPGNTNDGKDYVALDGVFRDEHDLQTSRSQQDRQKQKSKLKLPRWKRMVNLRNKQRNIPPFLEYGLLHETITSPMMSTGPPQQQKQQNKKSHQSIMNDCEFFYHDMNNSKSSAKRSRNQPEINGASFRALRPCAHQASFSYRDAVDVLSPPVLARYRAHYEQLNRPLPLSRKRSDGAETHTAFTTIPFVKMFLENNTHDLSLVEDDVGAHGSLDQQVDNTARQAAVEHSNLLYQHARTGRLLLKLPHDHVRLLMDPDLEVGVLSVEQRRKGRYRRKYKHSQAPATRGSDFEDFDEFANNESERPPLNYVLTVPEDLYRKLVSDLSDSVTKPYCGMRRCCNENEHVDIRVAIALFGLMLFILLVITFIWPTN